MFHASTHISSAQKSDTHQEAKSVLQPDQHWAMTCDYGAFCTNSVVVSVLQLETFTSHENIKHTKDQLFYRYSDKRDPRFKPQEFVLVL